MPKLLENKLAEFSRVFQREAQSPSREASRRSQKESILREFLDTEENLLQFSQCIGLYKIMLEQYPFDSNRRDKAFQFRPKKNWHRQEVQILTFVVAQLYLSGDIDIELVTQEQWGLIARFFNGRTADDCKFKWLSISRHPINSCVWDVEEQLLLRNILKQRRERFRDVDYENERPRWNKIARLFNARSHRNAQIYRNSKDLKRMWVSKICKIQKGVWKKEEDLMLFESVQKFGKRWSYISKKMHELRTENGVKNRFLSVMDKEINRCMVNKKIPPSQDYLVNKIIKRLRDEIENSGRNANLERDAVPLSALSANPEDAEKEELSGNPKNNPLVERKPQEPDKTKENYGNQIQEPAVVAPTYSQCSQSPFMPQILTPVVLNWSYFGQVPVAVMPSNFQFVYGPASPLN